MLCREPNICCILVRWQRVPQHQPESCGLMVVAAVHSVAMRVPSAKGMVHLWCTTVDGWLGQQIEGHWQCQSRAGRQLDLQRDLTACNVCP